MTKFFGREQELQALKLLTQKESASLAVIRGRRRIGKSRLIKEFGRTFRTIHFSGIPPVTKATAQSQREDFAKQIQRELNIPAPRADDWGDLFWSIAAHTKTGRVIVVIDEISWIGSKDPLFLGKLKNAWDLQFSNNSKLILILCGSVSSWIEENILSNTGFVGRISLSMKLTELPLKDCQKFWTSKQKHISSYEMFKVLSITGGVPKYLEEILPSQSAEKNIQRLCFRPDGILFNEFEHIFHDLFSKRSELYRKIVLCLAEGSSTLEQIYETLNICPTGVCTNYLDDLIQAGFVVRDHTWQLKSGKQSSLSKFRLSDNYLRFYLKVIAPIKAQIEATDLTTRNVASLPGWSSILGLQFENLVLHNLSVLYELLDLQADEILMRGPFFQRKTKRLAGCQVDLLIQTRHRSVYLCEIKYSKDPIRSSVIDEVQEKIRKIRLPRNSSIRPVLIHVNGVCDTVCDSDFFSSIIDFSQLINQFS